MPNWLTKATGGGTRDARDAPQTFQLTCECTERHAGQRLNRPQRIICHNCGSALFVLPRNAYPALQTRPSPSRGKKRRKRAEALPGVGPRLPSTSQIAASVRRGIAGAAGGVGRGVHTTARRTGGWITGSVAAVARAVRDFCTPFRLVVLAMGLMLVGTAAVAIRSRLMESARETLRTQLEAGQAALAEADYVAARGHLARATAAVERLGSDDPQSHLARQLHRETTAITQLAPGSLFDMLSEALQTQQRPGATSWQDVFGVRYDGTWLVLHAPVRRDDEGWIVALPLTVGTEHHPVVVRADLSAFDSLPASEGATPVIFAAPITGCRFDKAAGQWLVTLDGNAGFVWETLENLRPLGLLDDEWTSQDEIVRLLQSQSRLTGGVP